MASAEEVVGVFDKGARVEVVVDMGINGYSWRAAEIVCKNYSFPAGCEFTVLTAQGIIMSTKLLRPAPPKVTLDFCPAPDDPVEVFDDDSATWRPAIIVSEAPTQTQDGQDRHYVVQLCGSVLIAPASCLRPQQYWLGHRWLSLGRYEYQPQEQEQPPLVSTTTDKKRKSPGQQSEFNYDFDLSGQGTPPLSDYYNSFSSAQSMNTIGGGKRLRYSLEEFSDAESSTGSCSIHTINTAPSTHICPDHPDDDSDAESSYCFSPRSVDDQDKFHPLEFYCWL